jgi:threonine dehydratase
MVDPHLATAIAAADRRIRPTVIETPTSAWPQLAEELGGRVFVKQEQLQRTGSFKLRGATNAVVQAIPRGQHIVTASSGNHGIAVATALSSLGHEGTVFLPETVAPGKLAAVRRTGVTVVLHGTDSGETEIEAARVATANGWHYLSPYNDSDVIAGQGTIGAELLRQLDRIDVVYVSVGGGGLMSGVATALKAARPSIEVVGCSPVNSKVMHESVAAGRMLDLPSLPTFSDGTAGGVDPDTITFAYCRALVDRWITVDELAIATMVRRYIDDTHQLVEGAAGVAFAAMAQDARARRVPSAVVRVAIACGGNIDSTRLRELLEMAR